MSEQKALLVVDAQTSMFEGDDPPHDGEQVLVNIRTLIDAARASGTPVIYVRHGHARYAPMMVGNPGWEVHASIAPLADEVIIDKRACDSFHDTPLAETIAELGIEHLVVAGMQTELCVDTVCRSALHRDLNVTLAGDAHSTWARNGVSAAAIIAHHNATLADIPHPSKEIWVRPTAEIAFR